MNLIPTRYHISVSLDNLLGSLLVLFLRLPLGVCTFCSPVSEVPARLLDPAKDCKFSSSFSHGDVSCRTLFRLPVGSSVRFVVPDVLKDLVLVSSSVLKFPCIFCKFSEPAESCWLFAGEVVLASVWFENFSVVKSDRQVGQVDF